MGVHSFYGFIAALVFLDAGRLTAHGNRVDNF